MWRSQRHIGGGGGGGGVYAAAAATWCWLVKLEEMDYVYVFSIHLL
jgi:hypothetical protein